MLNIVCLKAGKAYGAEYVTILRDMVMRNLPAGTPGRFVCLTDEPVEGVECMELPADLETWWGKLYLFKNGLFPDGDRIVFFDLDTLIVGALDEIVKYDGTFAILNDFYRPAGLGSGVMLWEAGKMGHIWDNWVAAGKPRVSGGDQAWVETQTLTMDEGVPILGPDLLQSVFRGSFASFKVDCNPYPPKGTKVVCFHGQPKPHNCGGWVADIWKVGGGSMAELEIVCNTSIDKVVQNVRSACARDLPWLEEEPAHDGHAVIVGGGPSLVETLPDLKKRAAAGQTIFALNGAAKFLIERGVMPDCQVILDARAENRRFLHPMVEHYLLASQCDPSLFDRRFAKWNTTVFHVNTAGTREGIGDRPASLISTGSTVGLVAMGIAYVMGYRKLHLFGFDSSYRDYHHAYPQPLNDADAVIEATAGGRTFKCAPWMVSQVQQFQVLANQLADAGCVITVAGDGLLPHVAREMSKQLEAA